MLICCSRGFQASGVDLILSSGDRSSCCASTSRARKRAALASPDGAHSPATSSTALAGHTQFAQAAAAPGCAAVIAMSPSWRQLRLRSATVSRSSEQGDNVNKGDVVQSGSDSTLASLIDGTVFGLARTQDGADE